MKKYEDLTGLQYPHFTVIEPVYKEYQGKQRLYWKCKCECGKMFFAFKTAIKTGSTKSCGCFNKKQQKEMRLGKGKVSIGDKFGLLTVIDIEIDKNKSYYICECECGKRISLSPQNHILKRYSCGCLNKDYKDKTGISVQSFSHLGSKNKRNKSGCVGVTWNKDKHKWIASITFNGKYKYLGSFENKEDAIKARKEAENDLYSKHSDVINKMSNKNNAFT